MELCQKSRGVPVEVKNLHAYVCISGLQFMIALDSRWYQRLSQ